MALSSAHGWTFNALQSVQVASETNLVWKQTAPGMAGSNRGIYADSVDPDKVWVSPDMGQDYLTVDGGKHWKSVIPPDGPWTGRQELSDTCIVSDPKNPSVVLSLVDNGWWATPSQQIDLSTDGGVTFTAIASYASGSEPDSAWYCAVPHPADAGTWYFGNGNAFTEIRTAANPNPVDGVDTTVSKVWKITDITSASRTIEAVPDSGMDATTSVFDLICHPDTATYPDMLFAATSTGIYRKNDASSSWVQILDGCCKMDSNWDGANLTLVALQQATYTVSDGTLVSSGGVFASTAPETVSISSGWTDKTAGLRVDLTQLTLQPTALFPTFIRTWFDYQNDEEDAVGEPSSFFPNFDEIRIDPTNPNRVYLANGSRPNFCSVVTGAIWATLDGGSSWFAASRLGSGFTHDSYWTAHQPGRLDRNMELQVSENNFPDYWNYDIRGCRTMTMGADGTVYASIKKGYYTVKYDADADWWTSVDNTQVGDVYYGHGNCDVGGFGVIPDIHRDGEMFLLQQEASVWKTVDAVHPDFPDGVGAYELSGLQDEGPSWAPGLPYLVPTALAQHPSDTNVFYFMSPRTGDFNQSSDNGLSYEILGEPIYAPGTTTLEECIYWRHLRIAPGAAAIYAVAEVVDDDNVPMGRVSIYNPTAKKGVYKSTDEGATWTCMNSGFPVSASGRADGAVIATDSACVKALRMAPENQDVLYAAVKRYYSPDGGYVNGGLYRTANGATRWSAEEIPSGIKSLWDVWLHLEDGAVTKIYIAGGGDGDEADLGEGGVWVAEYQTGGGYVEGDWTKIFDHPFCTHVTTSPFDGDRVLIAAGESGGINNLNAGLYLTFTGGTSGSGSEWMKLNTGRGPLRTSSIVFDTGNPDRIWSSGEASGCSCLDLTPALDIVPLAIDHYQISGSQLMFGFDHGPTNRWFVLESKTNLQDAVWTTRMTGLPVSETGYGSVTNTTRGSQEFFRLIERSVPVVKRSGEIDFTAPDYSDGGLDGQQNWNAAAGWTVGNSIGTGYAATAANSEAAVLDEPILLSEGQSVSLCIDFQFGGNYSTPSGNVYAFLGGLKDSREAASVGTGDAAADANIQILTDDSYRLLSNYTVISAGKITGTELNAGDLLQFDYELTLGTDAASTVYTVRLQNLSDGTDTGVGRVSGVDDAVYSALTGRGAYGFFQSISPGNNSSGLSGVQVNAVTVAVQQED